MSKMIDILDGRDADTFAAEHNTPMEGEILQETLRCLNLTPDQMLE